MWTARARLPYLAAPASYTDPGAHEREVALLRRAWQPLSPDEAAEARGPIARTGALAWTRPDGEGAFEDDVPAATRALAERAFAEPFRLASFFTVEHPCNWKIPVENVLESYHVATLHRNVVARRPELFRVFGGTRETVRHELGEGFSSYHDTFGAGSALYRRMLSALPGEPTTDYVHHHVLPNVILATTGPFSFVQQVVPTSPRTSVSNIWLWLRVGGTWAARGAPARTLGWLAKRALEKILDEDASVYEAVQRGLASTTLSGALGTREDRIWHFHRDLAARAG